MNGPSGNRDLGNLWPTIDNDDGSAYFSAEVRMAEERHKQRAGVGEREAERQRERERVQLVLCREKLCSIEEGEKTQ